MYITVSVVDPTLNFPKDISHSFLILQGGVKCDFEQSTDRKLCLIVNSVSPLLKNTRLQLHNIQCGSDMSSLLITLLGEVLDIISIRCKLTKCQERERERWKCQIDEEAHHTAWDIRCCGISDWWENIIRLVPFHLVALHRQHTKGLLSVLSGHSYMSFSCFIPRLMICIMWDRRSGGHRIR